MFYKRTQKGFSLIETIITVVIFTAAVTVLLAQLSQFLAYTARAQAVMEKQTILQNQANILLAINRTAANKVVKDDTLLFRMNAAKNKGFKKGFPEEISVLNYSQGGEIKVSQAYTPHQLFTIGDEKTQPFTLTIIAPGLLPGQR